MIFRPVNPQSPIGPPITNRPVGLTKNDRRNSPASYNPSGNTGTTTCSHKSPAINDSAPSRCCVEINNFSTPTGRPSRYRTVTCVFPSGRKYPTNPDFRTSANRFANRCANEIGNGINSSVSSDAYPNIIP